MVEQRKNYVWDADDYAKHSSIFRAEVVDIFLERHPLDAEGNAHVSMVRLEVEASKPGKRL